MTEKPSNPLVPAEGNRGRGGKVTVEMLHEMAADLNRTNFARGLGWKYYVGKALVSGEERASLERFDIAPQHASPAGQAREGG